jgi:hypothetical protein
MNKGDTVYVLSWYSRGERGIIDVFVDRSDADKELNRRASLDRSIAFYVEPKTLR